MMTTPIPSGLEPYLRKDLEPQAAFTYPQTSWNQWLGHIPEVAEVLPTLPQAIDRSTASSLVADLLKTNPVGAYTVAMIWGHGKVGYGAFRTARTLTAAAQPHGKSLDLEVVEKIRRSSQIAQSDSPTTAYAYLNNEGKIKHLGPAFFTKWIYFASSKGTARHEKALPILDDLVIAWLRKNEVLDLRYARSADYEKYVELMHQWAKQSGLTPVHVEEAIFQLIRHEQRS